MTAQAIQTVPQHGLGCGAASPKSAPSAQSLADAMASLTSVLQSVQEEISESTEAVAQANVTVAKANISAVQANIDKIDSLLSELAHKLKEAKKWGMFTKILGGVLTGLIDAIALATGNIALAVVATGLYAAMATNTFSKTASHCATLYQDMGCSKNTAEILGSVTVVAIVMALTFALCPASAGEEAGEEGAEAAQEAAESIMSKIKAALQAMAPARDTGAALMVGSQATQATGLLTALVVEIAKDAGASPSRLNDIQNAMTYVSAIATSLVGLYGGVGLGANGGSAAKTAATDAETESEEASESVMLKIKALMSKIQEAVTTAATNLKNALPTSTIVALLSGAALVAGLGQAAGDVGVGAVSIQQGNLTKDSTAAEGDLSLERVLTSMINEISKQAIDTDNQNQSAFQAANAGYSQKLAAGQLAVAQMLSQHI